MSNPLNLDCMVNHEKEHIQVINMLRMGEIPWELDFRQYFEFCETPAMFLKGECIEEKKDVSDSSKQQVCVELSKRIDEPKLFHTEEPHSN